MIEYGMLHIFIYIYMYVCAVCRPYRGLYEECFVRCAGSFKDLLQVLKKLLAFLDCKLCTYLN